MLGSEILIAGGLKGMLQNIKKKEVQHKRSGKPWWGHRLSWRLWVCMYCRNLQVFSHFSQGEGWSNWKLWWKNSEIKELRTLIIGWSEGKWNLSEGDLVESRDKDRKDEKLVFCGCLSKRAGRIWNWGNLTSLMPLVLSRQLDSWRRHLPFIEMGRQLKGGRGSQGEDKENCDEIGRGS